MLRIMFILTLAICATICFSFDLKSGQANSFTFNTTTINSILKKIDYLHLHLGSTNDAANNFVQYLLKQSICRLQITVADNETNHIHEPQIFQESNRHRSIVLSYRNLNVILKRYATRAGVFICILLDEPNENEIWNFAHQLWIERGIYQIYYIGQRKSVFFNPFPESSEQHHRGRGTLVDINVMRLEDIFHNLHHYPLRTYIFDSVYSTVFGNVSTKRITSTRGADGNVAKLLSKMMNFTMDLQWPDDEFFGARLNNGTYNGAIGRLMRYEADITLTGFFVKDYLTRDVEFSVSVYMDELCCYVMKAKRIPQSILPLFAVDIDIWFTFLLAGTLSPLVWMTIRHLNLYFGIQTLSTSLTRSLRFSSRSTQYIRIFIDTWLVWVRVNIVKFPPFHAERVFVISLCLVSVIFGALLESSLATVFIRPLYYKDINTMQELDDANFRIYIKHAAMKDDLFYGHSSTVYKNLDKKLLLVAETEERLISMMSKRGGFAAVTRASSLELDDIRYFITKKIHKIPECPKNYHIAFLMPKQSPFEKQINSLLLRFIAAGLVDQWIEEMMHEAKISIHNFPDYVAELGDMWKVFTLKDLQLAFYALGFGGILATLVFLCECILGFIYRKR